MDLDLGEDVAVVVGGASGLGYAIADAFRDEGAGVVILDRSPDTPDIAVGFGHVVDATDYAAVKAFASRMGRVDHVVFAAGVGSGKFGFPFWNRDEIPKSLE